MLVRNKTAHKQKKTFFWSLLHKYGVYVKSNGYAFVTLCCDNTTENSSSQTSYPVGKVIFHTVVVVPHCSI